MNVVASLSLFGCADPVAPTAPHTVLAVPSASFVLQVALPAGPAADDAPILELTPGQRDRLQRVLGVRVDAVLIRPDRVCRVAPDGDGPTG
ncbi:MAG: hypothetical protein H6733_04865 [Alphaproteobacteria bacterium]|nr:hypothetical protein [Alphaproteobacteria bacterium]